MARCFISIPYYHFSVGGTAGAIITCPLEVVKTRLQSSNSGFETKLRATAEPPAPAKPSPSPTTGYKGSQVVYRPALGSQYSLSVRLLNCNPCSTCPILYSTHSQPCRPIQSKLNAFQDRTSARAKVHTGAPALEAANTARPSMGVTGCLRYQSVNNSSAIAL